MEKKREKMQKMEKNREILGKIAKKREKMRKIETFFNRGERKDRRDFLDRMTGFFKPQKGTKGQNFLTAENAGNAERNWPRRHEDTEKNQPRPVRNKTSISNGARMHTN